ncbi:MAG: pyridoxamine 5'-phosphate oxidase family protein [Oscillibacter sp.]|nr:pyridoxamine 5'-phosphate oxidase family protein [Oscillibacter sp.]
MRRRDREVTDLNEILHILDTCKVVHLGLVEDGKPYIVPMNFGYSLENDGKLVLYVHGALEGRKLDVIRKNPACCAQMECEGTLIEGNVACQYGYSYYSLEGFGNAYIVDDPEEKMKGLTLLMKAQTGKDFQFNERLVTIVSVVRIECDTYTAKHRPLPEKHNG